MKTVNDLLVDESIRHQIQLLKYSNHTVRKMIAVLNRADASLRTALLSAVESANSSTDKIQRLESLLGSVRAMNSQAYSQLGTDIGQALKDFTLYEAAYTTNVLTQFTPVAVSIASISAESVYAAAMARPFQGVLLKNVLVDLEANRARRIRQKVAQGFVENKTTDQIVRDIFGTKKNQYADGLLEVSRREARAVVRTAMGHLAGFVQDSVAEANADLMAAVQWLSTLDLRTSSICRIRDNKLYDTVSHKPIKHNLPWLGGPGRAHWACRSAQVYVMKSAEQLGLPSNTDVVLRNGTRATMDGQVAKETTYADWIKEQSFARQSEVLGPTRAKLLRDGKLPLERMYSLNGQFLDLSQLQASDAAAFKRAGL